MATLSDGQLLTAMFIALFCGIVIGRNLEAIRWRRNADVIQRIESKGKLYKVVHDP